MRVFLWLFALGFAALTTACGESAEPPDSADDDSYDGPQGQPEEAFVLDHDDPRSVMEAALRAEMERDAETMLALIHPPLLRRDHIERIHSWADGHHVYLFYRMPVASGGYLQKLYDYEIVDSWIGTDAAAFALELDVLGQPTFDNSQMRLERDRERVCVLVRSAEGWRLSSDYATEPDDLILRLIGKPLEKMAELFEPYFYGDARPEPRDYEAIAGDEDKPKQYRTELREDDDTVVVLNPPAIREDGEAHDRAKWVFVLRRAQTIEPEGAAFDDTSYHIWRIDWEATLAEREIWEPSWFVD